MSSRLSAPDGEELPVTVVAVRAVGPVLTPCFALDVRTWERVVARSLLCLDRSGGDADVPFEDGTPVEVVAVLDPASGVTDADELRVALRDGHVAVSGSERWWAVSASQPLGDGRDEGVRFPLPPWDDRGSADGP